LTLQTIARTLGVLMKTLNRWYFFFFGAYLRPAARV
jgi:hypothetical protein